MQYGERMFMKKDVQEHTPNYISSRMHIIGKHTCQSLRVGRSHYAFLDKLTTTGVVGKDYGFMLVWRCNFVGNHLITFGLFLDEVMGLSQYC